MIIEYFNNPPRSMPSGRDAVVIKLRVELIEAQKRIAELEKERDAALIRIAEIEEDDGNDLFQPDGTWTHVRVD